MKKFVQGGFFTAFLFLMPFNVVSQTETPVNSEENIIIGQPLNPILEVVPVPARSSLGSFFQVLFALALVVALIYGFVKIMKKLSGRTEIASNNITVLSSHSLTSATSLHLIEVEGAVYLIGSGDNITLLDRLSDSEQIDKIRLNASKINDAPLNFMQQLSQQLKKNGLVANQKPQRNAMRDYVSRIDSLKNKPNQTRNEEEGKN